MIKRFVQNKKSVDLLKEIIHVNKNYITWHKTFFIGCLIALFNISNLYSQEYISDMPLNGFHSQNQLKSFSIKPFKMKQITTLPFIDDFSSKFGSVDTSKWYASSAYVNNSFVDTFLSPGILTFDALDNNNNIYTQKNDSVDVAADVLFLADSLVSHSFKLNKSSSYYLSFYYLPGGLGNQPEAQDSLVVEFYLPDSSKYFREWSSPGFDTSSSAFKQAIIKIPAKYYTDSFIFKIRNYASLEKNQYGLPETYGNKDQWHIDYVTLQETANEDDLKDIPDATFRKKLNGLIKTDPEYNFTYSQMPYNHFVVNSNFRLRDTCYVTNYYTSEQPFRYEYEVNSIAEDFSFTSGDQGERDYPSLEISPIAYRFSAGDFVNMPLDKPLTLSFKIILSEINIPGNITSNDTLEHIQVFDDYYAYDDGSPEKSYGFLAPSKSIFAQKFTNYKPAGDSLRYVMIYFNPTLNNESLGAPLKIGVWALGKDGNPGTLLYISEEPERIKTFGFQKFYLEQPVFVEGDFFIGWQQEENVFPPSQNYLNIGYDANTSNYGRSYKFISSEWEKSSGKGTVMIRAGFGKETITSEQHVIVDNLTLYPNPGNGNFFVRGLTNYPYTIQIFDILGRKTSYKTLYNNHIDLSNLSTGVYIVKLFDSQNKPVTQQKVIIQK